MYFFFCFLQRFLSGLLLVSFGVSFAEVNENRVVLCTRMAREELWWENGILPSLPPDGCECEVALTVAPMFGVAEGGAKQRRSHVEKGEGSFCSCACFPFIIIHPIPFL